MVRSLGVVYGLYEVHASYGLRFWIAVPWSQVTSDVPQLLRILMSTCGWSATPERAYRSA